MKTNVNGMEMAYEILGQTGYPIVLIHGFALDHRIWLEMGSKHLRNHRVILPDMRGHGESDTPNGAYPMVLMAQDLAHLLDYLQVNKAIVCGHSMGGYVALAFAAKYPERLAGLGLITTRAHADTDEKREGRYQMIEKVRERGSIAIAEALAPRLSHDEEIMRQTKEMIVNTSPQGIIGALQGMAERPNRLDLLPEIEVPSLVVAGKDDQIIDLPDAREMADALPHAEFLPIYGAGHMPMKEKPVVLAEGLNNLVKRVKGFH